MDLRCLAFQLFEFCPMVSLPVRAVYVSSPLISVIYPLPLFSFQLSAAREAKMFSENEIRNILFQVLSGLALVHKHGKSLVFVHLSPVTAGCV